jgi:hypothetical protein
MNCNSDCSRYERYTCIHVCTCVYTHTWFTQ